MFYLQRWKCKAIHWTGSSALRHVICIRQASLAGKVSKHLHKNTELILLILISWHQVTPTIGTELFSNTRTHQRLAVRQKQSIVEQEILFYTKICSESTRKYPPLSFVNKRLVMRVKLTGWFFWLIHALKLLWNSVCLFPAINTFDKWKLWLN